jgi:type I restriction enzyme, S subunit
VSLPPFAEQQRIVAKVDELMAICDKLQRSLTAVETGRARALEAVLAEVLEEPGAQAAVQRTAA